MIPHYNIEHYIYGKLTAVVGEFCFFEMGLTHSKHTTPHEFLGKAEAEAFLASTYPGDDSYKVVPCE